jgi:hypothetical protein
MLVALAPQERECARFLFGILGVSLPGIYGAWRFYVANFESSISFYGVLFLTLLVPFFFGILCVVMVWKRRTFISVSSVGFAFLLASLWFGFIASYILLLGRMPSKYHSYAVPRDSSIPIFFVAALALLIGGSLFLLGRVQKSTQRLERQ